MKVFVVNVWNGLDYDECEHYNVGVFSTLEAAREYCKNNPPVSDDYFKEKLDIDAYSIQEWEDTERITVHDVE